MWLVATILDSEDQGSGAYIIFPYGGHSPVWWYS